MIPRPYKIIVPVRHEMNFVVNRLTGNLPVRFYLVNNHKEQGCILLHIFIMLTVAIHNCIWLLIYPCLSKITRRVGKIGGLVYLELWGRSLTWRHFVHFIIFILQYTCGTMVSFFILTTLDRSFQKNSIMYLTYLGGNSFRGGKQNYPFELSSKETSSIFLYKTF